MKTLSLYLFILIALTPALFSQEIPNGDGDLLWERSLIVDGISRTVNDAKFHPINGNIIAAVNHEIWEIDPKDGHTIRVFEGPSKIDDEMYLTELNISPDGNLIVTNGLQYYSGIYFWDYNEGKHIDSLNYFSLNGRFYPDNETMLFWARPTPGGLKEGLVKYNYKTKKVISKKEFNNEQYLQIASLSKDGKYLAVGFSNGNHQSGWYFTMELWNAETLTKIKDFGSPGDIHEFRDVQISDDNQYVGFRGDNLLFLYTITGKELKIPLQKYVYSFAFTPNCKFITLDIETIDNQENVYIYELSSLNKSYMYTNIFPRIMRYNTNNDFFISKMRLYSNHWYEVGITNPLEKKIQIKNTSYTNNSLQITTEGIEIIKILMITDTLGKKIYIKNEIPVLNNKTEIPLSLPSGNYLLKIVSNGKEYTSKFVVVR